MIKAKIVPLLTSLAMLMGLAACTVPVSATTSSPEGAGTSLKTLDGGTVSSAELEAFIAETMEKAGVTGLSCAVINDSEIVYQKAFGLRDAEAGTPSDEETIFAAASFSKPVFAYLVMLLAEEGVIDLDKPLYEYLSQPLPDYPAYADLKEDERYKQITGRMVLSHSTGFPNWRFLTEDGTLSITFPPGTRYSYSGEGIVLLQMVVEEITGRDLEALAQEKVFRPLGMTRSSYVWQEAYEEDYALPHDEYGRPQMLKKREEADAAGSMATTAGDYARILVEMLNPEGGREALVDDMLEPQIAITSETMFGPGAWQEADEDRDIRLSWGLGWGRFDSEHGRAFFHTGHDFGWQNYTVAYPDRGIGVVLLSNSDNFESVAHEIVGKAIGDIHSPFDWLGYVPFDPSQKKEPPPPEPVAVELDPAILEAYVGVYELRPEDLIHIKLGDEGLLIGDGQDWMPLYAESETQFFAEVDDARVVFVVDAAGEVTGLSLTVQGMELPPARKVATESAPEPSETPAAATQEPAATGSSSTEADRASPEEEAYWPTEAWRVAAPAEGGVNAALLGQMLDAIDEQNLNIDSVVVVHNGYIVTEKYYPPYKQDTLHGVYSITKSVVSALIGIAIQEGYIHSVDDVVLGFYPGRTFQNDDALKRSITLEHLLTMSSGLAWDWDEMVSSRDWVQYTLDQPMVSEPGTEFHYSSGNAHVLSAIIQEASGLNTRDFAQLYLFDPLGISDVRWKTDLDGIPKGGWGMGMKPRDMAKLGYLYLNGGVWDGRQIIPAEWIEASTERHIQVPEPLEPWDLYMGYLWWLHEDGPYAAHGTKGQFIYVIPESDLVVVFTGDVTDARYAQPQLLIRDYIIPAVTATSP